MEKYASVRRWAGRALITLVLVLGALTASPVSQLDWYPQLQTYGFSVGTANHYCYADLVHGSPSVGCERAR